MHDDGGDAMLAGARLKVNGRKAGFLLGALLAVGHFQATEDQAASGSRPPAMKSTSVADGQGRRVSWNRSWAMGNLEGL